jgi:hypothetical protein
VIREVDGDATFGQGIGQQHVLHLPNTTLVVLNASAQGLQIVADQANQGRTWRSPLTVPEIVTDSFAADADADGRIHLAFVTGTEVSYVRLTLTASGWTSSAPLTVDSNAASSVVDVAWDGARQLVHVVWAQSASGGQSPAWAAVRSRGDPKIVELETLAGAGSATPVLVNVATSGLAAPPSQGPAAVTATYRRGDSAEGWRSRTAGAGAEQLDWGAEEQLPIDGEISAAALAMDPRGTAHLVVHDSTSGRLAYSRRGGRTGWTSPETAVEGPDEGTLGMPVISVDGASRMVYVFFERSPGPGQPTRVVLAVRDPATGWEDAYEITRASETPDGSVFPNSLEHVLGQAIVAWTSPGRPARIQVARVTAP